MATFAEYVFLHIANAVPDESFQSLKENEVFAREFPRRPKCRLPVHARPPLFLCREVNIAMVSNSKRFHAVLRTLCVHRSAKIGTRLYLINYLRVCRWRWCRDAIIPFDIAHYRWRATSMSHMRGTNVDRAYWARRARLRQAHVWMPGMRPRTGRSSQIWISAREHPPISATPSREQAMRYF